jgi:hypothetical protein
MGVLPVLETLRRAERPTHRFRLALQLNSLVKLNSAVSGQFWNYSNSLGIHERPTS